MLLMSTITQISILNDFSEYPKLRYCDLSEDSAEKFYHTILNEKFAQALQNDGSLEVNLDNTAGYTSSFLDEAFGNLVFDFTLPVVKKSLLLISNDEPYWIDMIEKETFEEWEKRRISNTVPKKTVPHLAWYRMIDKKLEKKVWIDV